MFNKAFKGLALALGVSALMVPAAFAADGTTVSITGGSLTISNPAATDFGAVALNGAATSTTATLAGFTVNDATGSGSGWHVTAHASQFAEWDGSAYVSSGKTLALGSLAMTHAAVTADGTDSTAPSVASGDYTIDDASAVTVATAAADTGMGKYNFDPSTLTLSLPANVYARDYHSDVTVDVVSAP